MKPIADTAGINIPSKIAAIEFYYARRKGNSKEEDR